MKKILMTTAIMFLGALFCSPVSFADGKYIKFEKLPQDAKAFITEFFKDKAISWIKAEHNEYEVRFADGAKIEFDRSGWWKEIECEVGKVPEEIIPVRIIQYIKEHFPSDAITSIERSRWGYEVSLSSDLELEFDKNCNFVRIDD